jgi:hypothetical protein
LAAFLACLGISKPGSAAPQDSTAPSAKPAAPAAPRKADPRKAKEAYAQGAAAEKANDWQAAFAGYSDAVEFSPDTRGYLVHREIARSRLVQVRVDTAERDAVSGRLDDARRELMAASYIDPTDSVVRDRLAELIAAEPDQIRATVASPDLASTPQLAYAAGAKSFDYRGDTKGAYEELGKQFGVEVAFDVDLRARQIRFQATDVDFRTAARLLGNQTATFWRPLSSRLFFVADNTPQKRRDYDISAVRTILLPASESPEEMTEALRVLRDVTGITRTQLDTNSHTIILRASPQSLAVATDLLDDLQKPVGELILEIEILEIDRTSALNLGVTPPTKSTIVMLTPQQVQEAQQSFAGLVDVITQLFGTPSSLSGLTSTQISSLLTSGQVNPTTLIPPVVAVGGGKSTFLATMPGAAATFSKVLSTVRNGRRMLLRARDGQPATFFVGERFPVSLATFSPSLAGGGAGVSGLVSSNFPATNYAVGAAPSFVTTASLRGNSTNDIIVANSGDNDISVLLGNGDGTFPTTAVPTFTTGNDPVWIATGNFTSQARLDLAVANQGDDTVSILLGDGSGGFSGQQNAPIPVGSGPVSVVAANFHDSVAGHPLDLAVANQADGSIWVLEGHGDGTFSSPTPAVTIQQEPATLQVGASASLSATVANDPLNKGVIWGVTCHSQTSVCGSFVPATTLNGVPTVFTAPGTVPSGTEVTITATSVADNTKVASVLVTITATPPGIHVTLSGAPSGLQIGGTTSVTATVANDSMNQGVTWSVTCAAAPCGSFSSIGTASGVATIFTAPVTAPSNGSITVTATSVTDTTKSVSIDIAITATAPAIGVILSGEPAEIQVGTTANIIATVANDAQNKGVTWSCTPAPCGAFSPATTASGIPTTYTAPVSVPAGNAVTVTATSVADAAMSASATFVVTASAPAQGSVIPIAPGFRPTALVAADFNGDGHTDLAVTGAAGNVVQIYIGNGDGTFRTGTTLSTGADPVYIVTGDFDGDGHVDLAVANQTDGTVSIFLGKGDGTFTAGTAVSAGSQPTSLAVADFNVDGRPDIIVADQGDNATSFLLNLNGGSFGPNFELPVNTGPVSVATADFNGDGKPDAVTANFGANDATVTLNSSAFSATNPLAGVPFPGVEYIDIGLKVKATPRIHPEDEVSLKLDFDISSLTGQAFNAIPVISKQAVVQTVRVREDETAVLAGFLQSQLSNAISGTPGVADIPIAGLAASTINPQRTDSELLILVTPRQVRFAERKDHSIYAGQGSPEGSGAAAPPPNVQAPLGGNPPPVGAPVGAPVNAPPGTPSAVPPQPPVQTVPPPAQPGANPNAPAALGDDRGQR